MIDLTDCEIEYDKVNANDPDSVLKRLAKGNSNYKNGDFHCIQQNVQPASTQQPYATVLSCSDSRVIPERIFDAGPGELFVARVAGNVVNDDISASFEYALNPLESRVIIVMGHSCCGAVEAAFPESQCVTPVTPVQSVFSSCLTKLVENIKAAVANHDEIKTVIQQNVIGQARKLLHNECILQTRQRYWVYGAFYNKKDKSVQIAKIGKVINGRVVNEIVDPKWINLATHDTTS